MSSALLSLPGATLSYSISGSGPLLLLIAGSGGDSKDWRWLSQLLSTSFTVCGYARRGFRDSTATSPQNYSAQDRLARDVDDAAELVRSLSPQRPAYVVGTSSGTLVALELLVRYPDLVRAMVCHESLLVDAMPQPNASELHAAWDNVYNTYQTQGLPAAIDLMAAELCAEAEVDILRERLISSAYQANVGYFLENELRQYSALEPDYDALRACNDKLFLTCGRDTMHRPLRNIQEGLANRTGAQLRLVPGGHIPYLTSPPDFAEAIVKIFLPTPPHMWPMFVP